MIISTDIENAFDKLQHAFFYNKNFQPPRARRERPQLNLNKNIYKSPRIKYREKKFLTLVMTINFQMTPKAQATKA